ncbi:MAG: hypothetical protein ACP5K7_04645 [Verrucomicrobiia bacterium]
MENQNHKSVWKKEIKIGFSIPFKKIAGGILIFFGILLILVMVFQIVENVRGKRALEKWKAQHKDITLEIKRYVPLPVPDDKNLAMSGIFKTVVEVYGEGTTKETNAINDLTRFNNEYEAFFKILQESRGKRIKSSFSVKMPISILETNYVDLKKVAEDFRKKNYKDCGSISNDAECVLKAMSGLTPYLDALISESKQRELFRFPIDYEPENPAEILLPHYSYLKRMLQLIQIRSVCYIELNKADAAFEDVRFGLKLANSIKDEPFLISLLVRVSMLNIVLENIREGIARGMWTDGQLAEFQKYLSGIDLLKDLRGSLATEEAFGAKMLMLFQNRDYFIKYFEPGCTTCCDNSFNNFTAPTFWLIPNGWFYQNAVTFCNVIEERKQILDNIIRDRRNSPMSAHFEKLAKKPGQNPYTIFANFLLATEKVFYRTGISQTAVELCNVACAIERYRLANGKLPDRLTKLIPSYLSSAPVCLFDGKEFRYNRINQTDYGLIAAVPDLNVLDYCEKCIGIPLLSDGEIVFRRIK